AMHQMLCDVALDEAARRRLEALPGVTLRTLPPHERGWELQEDLLRGPEFLLCKLPPRNVDGMADLKLIQLSSVGYEHLRHRGFEGKPVRVCNARGLFDPAIAEWVLAMIVN